MFFLMRDWERLAVEPCLLALDTDVAREMVAPSSLFMVWCTISLLSIVFCAGSDGFVAVVAAVGDGGIVSRDTPI